MSPKRCSWFLPSLPWVAKSFRWRRKDVDQFGGPECWFQDEKTSEKSCSFYGERVEKDGLPAPKQGIFGFLPKKGKGSTRLHGMDKVGLLAPQASLQEVVH